MNDYRIWISYHKDEFLQQYNLREDDSHRLFPTHKEAEGKNINPMNPVYSEIVTLWYVWKNNLKTPYVGFNHYRRRFDVSRLPKKGECQVYRIADFGRQTVYRQYAKYHNADDMDAMISILDSRHGEGNAYTKYIREGNMLVANCCFLMKWTDFTKLCQFLFPLLDDFASHFGCQTVDDWRRKAEKDFGTERTEYQTRVVSFLAERLISAWIAGNLTPYIDKRNVAIVNYNTTELVEAAIRSLMKHTPGCTVYVFDNSDRTPFKTKLRNVDVIDNTKQQLVNFDAELEKHPDKWAEDTEKSNYGSMKHTMSVDKLMELVPDGFVLMDSDVLVKSDIKGFFDREVACMGSMRVKHDVPQLEPFLCWLNVPMLKEKGITYYNGDKMWALSRKDPNQHYETGAWLLEQVRQHSLPVNYTNISNYVIHYGHGSWRDKGSAEWLDANKEFHTI